jgi:tetratricopeptide (TPR) repeat protein
MLSGFVRSSFIVIFLSCLTAACAAAQSQSPGWQIVGPAFAASPADIQAAAQKIQAEPLMEATVLFERDAFTLDAAGRMTYKHDLIYRIETEDGVKNWSEIRVGWSPWYQNTPEINARVIAPDGKVSTLDQKTITDGPAREDSQDTYSDARIRKVPLPALVVGAIVEQQTVSADREPKFSGGITGGDSFSWSVPFHRGQLVVDLPASLNFRIDVFALPNATIKNEVVGDTRHYLLDQGYVAPWADSDISLPTHNFLGHGTRFSTGDSWASVAAAYRKLAEVNIDPAKVKSLLPKPGANRMETIARIVAVLQKDVRYTGIEFGEASLQPAPAAEILKRHYGDCKDKAALLVAMLRAAGIDANLALLDTGPGRDVDADLPGMQFDHAIVYVPAAQGADPLWIDATAEDFEVGTLPSMDESRNALIIAEGTSGLTMTPAAKPDDDKLTELRDVTLADYGPSHIVETSMTHGEVDASYRSLYGELTRDQKEDLEKYAKNAYSAKALAAITHGDEHELSKPFALKLDMTEARRGDTGIDDAVVNIPFGDIFYRLPKWFRTDPGTEGVKLTPQQEENRKRAVAARTSEYDVHPFATEWRYTIAPPEGFAVRALPGAKTVQMGPATYKQSFEAGADGKVIATLRFENAKPQYTTDEALALRDAVLAAFKQDSVAVWFDQTGAKLLSAGKAREALANDLALIQKHPDKSIHHARLAYAYLKAGLGAKARKEAQEAARLDPKSAINFRALGLMCEYNDVSVILGTGFDRDCAVNAFKKALEIDPDDSNNAYELATIEEYDQQGERYTAGAHLSDAIAGLRDLAKKDKAAGDQHQDNLLLDLLYSGHYQELLGELDKLSSSPIRRGITIAATVALQSGEKGIAAGIDRADRLSANASDRTAALASAGNYLMRMRLYREATGMLSAAVEGQQDASSGTAQQIAAIRNVNPWKGEYLPATDPRSVVQRWYITTMNGEFTEATAKELLSRHAYGSDEEWQRNAQQVLEKRDAVHVQAERSNLAWAELVDVLVGNLKLAADGDDESGYRITVDSLGAKSIRYFVSRDDGAYRIVAADSSKSSEAGNEALYLLKSGREKEARSLLDWMRESMHKGGGDDPLSGPLFPRFWTVGDPATAEQMQWAAAALAAGNSTIKGLIPDLRAAWEKAPQGDSRTSFTLLLAEAYRTAQDGARLKEVAAELLKSYPDSYTAIGMAAGADEFLKDWDDWKQMLDAQIARHPSDETLLRMKAGYYETRGDWPAARATIQSLIDKGKATAADYNRLAWSALFDNKADDDTVKAARQATSLTNNTSFSELHTLACLYAAQGKTSEARDLLFKTMRGFNMDVPNESVWFAFAMLYEQYGINDAAIDAYQKVQKPEGYFGPTSTYVLAQSRLKALQGKSN